MLQKTFDRTLINSNHFPQCSYLGAKYHIRDWIVAHFPKDCLITFDAFAGSHCIAYEMKRLYKKVISNDFMRSNYHIGKALIENQTETLTSADLDLLLGNNSEKSDLIEKNYAEIFFLRDDCILLDTMRKNIRSLTLYKQSLALTLICHAMKRKVALNHFANLKTMEYRANPDRVKRNPSLMKTFRQIIFELNPEYAQAIFNNHQNNETHCEDIINLLPKIKADVVYFDPPYYPNHVNYQDFYHVLETFVEYWNDKEYINNTHHYSPQKTSLFESKKTILSAFEQLFEQSRHIPFWLLSYNSYSYPSHEYLLTLLQKYRTVKIEKKEYRKSYGGKGSIKGSYEILFICQ